MPLGAVPKILALLGSAARPGASASRARPAGSPQRLLDAADRRGRAPLLDELAEAFELDVREPRPDRGRRARRRPRRRTAERAGPRGLLGQRIALDREPSGINAVVREGTAFAVYDAESSEVVNQRLNAIAKVKSCVFVPVRAQEEVIGVVFGGVRRPRVFEEDELALDAVLREREAGLALERSRATAALGEALERERLIAQISLELRSDATSTRSCPRCSRRSAAAAAVRCFVRLGEPGEQIAVVAEWTPTASRRSAMRSGSRHQPRRADGRTVAIADVLAARS